MSISRRVVAVSNPQHEVDSRAPDQHAFVVLPSGVVGMHAPQARWIVLISGDTDRDHPFAGDHVKGERMACVGGPRREQEPVRPTIAFTCKMNRIQLGEHRCRSSSEAVSVGTGEKVLFRQ